jgi:signal transduction histidine kinase
VPLGALLPSRLRLPSGAIGVGPGDWLAGHGAQGVTPVVYADLAACLDALRSDGGEAPAIFLNGPHLATTGQLEVLAPWLATLTGVDASATAVLVGGDVDGRTCAALVRAGLFDFLAAGEPAAAWRALRERILRRRSRAATGRAMSTEAESTQRMLREQWRQVQADAAREAAALVRAQTDVEALNRQLAAHMEQLSLLYRFGRELSVAKNWDATLKGFLEHLAPFVGAVGAALVLRAAPRGGYAPRQIYRWDEASWDRVLVNVTREVDGAIAGSLLAPGVFRIGGGRSPAAGGITALPLEHQGGRLGYLLLLFATHEERERRTAAVLPFLQMVQVVLSEEVAGAQMLDRIREIGTFNARVLQTVRSAIWVCDQSARTIFVNHAARRLLGVEVLDEQDNPQGVIAVGRGRMGDWVNPPHAERDDLPEIFLEGRLRLEGLDQPGFAALYALNEPFRGEGRVEGSNGLAVPVLVYAAPMPGRWRDERWLLVVAEDLREARRAEASRRRADRLESLVEMSATLAHEIRNPLAGLSAQAELLAEHLPAADPRKRYLDVITGEVGRIDQTITRMLQFTRPYAPQRQTCDVAALARDCLALAAVRAKGRKVKLALELEQQGGDAWLGELDPVQIKQVFLNLVVNGIDAAPVGGKVTLRLLDRPRLEIREPVSGALRVQRGLEVAVEDNGQGFGNVDVESLFRPFYTTKSTGTGLGLAISRKIVMAHGGEILAEREGAITRMRVLLPRESLAGAVASAGEAT